MYTAFDLAMAATTAYLKTKGRLPESAVIPAADQVALLDNILKDLYDYLDRYVIPKDPLSTANGGAAAAEMFAGLGHHLRFLRRIFALEIPSRSVPLPPFPVPSNPFSVTLTQAAVGSLLRPPCFYLHRMRRRIPTERIQFCTLPAQPEHSDASPYLSVRIRCLKRDADMLSDALLCFGANSASMDELSDSHDLDEIWITCIFADHQDVYTCISQAVGSFGLNYVPKYEISAGKICDWTTNVQESFHPIEVVTGLWIVPKWREPPDLQATNIILDPGMAFGTGEHPTTKLCLMLLHRLLHGGELLLDYGTGSGILGIAAVKMGASSSVGIDIDPQAVISARENMALNGISSSKMSVYLVPNETGTSNADEETKNPEKRTLLGFQPDCSKGKFDFIIANILLNPLIELAVDIVSYGRPGSNIGLSGILSEQVQQIKEIYSQYLENISVSDMEGWACIHGTKKEKLDM
ncbi:ribosomal protein L11 methyltransferase-like [Zingiber officinale]|nr:ribosomal protein L11 methyltransferase-like [Zingiber officinale]